MTFGNSIAALAIGALSWSPWLPQNVLGVQGYGAWATGGAQSSDPNNPGQPYVVTVNTLDERGEGSLYWALNEAAQNNGAIIEFAVGGVIKIPSTPLYIPSNTTIAGETAPSPGITIYGHRTRVDNAENVIVRHVRFRMRDEDLNPNYEYGVRYGLPPGKKDGTDCFSIYMSDLVLVEHCSMAWGNDETFEVFDSNYVTVEYCIIAETLRPHSMGMLLAGSENGSGYMTIHHNLFVSHDQRSALITSLGLPGNNHVEFYNNVVYNWGEDGTHTPENYAEHANIVGNYYRPGPSTPASKRQYAIYVRSGATAYVSGNHFESGASAKFEDGSTAAESWVVPKTMDPVSAWDAYTDVVSTVGPSFGYDPAGTDQRLLDDVVFHTGSVRSDPPLLEVNLLIYY